MRFKGWLIFLTSVAVVFAGNDVYNRGKSLGERFIDRFGKDGSKVKSGLMDPAMGKGNYTDLNGNVLELPAPFCGKGGGDFLQSERPVMVVEVSGQNVYVRYSTDGRRINRYYRFSGRYHCAGAVCSSLNSCRELYIDGAGNLRTRYTSRAYSCADVSRYPQPATLIGGKLINELIESYNRRGIELAYSREEVMDNRATYYASEVNDRCVSSSEFASLSASGDPVTMERKGLERYRNCDPSDPSCSAVKTVFGSAGSKSYRSCTIERVFGAGEKICERDQKIYPFGYNERNTICFAGDRWKDYSSSFWLQCNSTGTGYTLYGWGYWEGAPCGGGRLYPPSPQIRFRFNPKSSIGWREIGRLSVNRRRGGENVIELDRATQREKECVSSDPTPYKVRVRNINYGRYAYLYVRVDNAPSCRSFTFKIDYPVRESISDGCKRMEEQGCRLVNEWWVDARGRRVQTVRDGVRVLNVSECQENSFDNASKNYSGSAQTMQSPPQNCAGIQRTCKYVGGEYVCRTWWRKIREYECASSYRKYTYDLSRARRVVSSAYANVDENSGRVDWGYEGGGRKRAWTPGSRCRMVCAVRMQDGTREIRNCEGTANNPVCPSAGAQVEEGCKCIEDSVSGMGYAVGVMGAINEAFKNRECK